MGELKALLLPEDENLLFGKTFSSFLKEIQKRSKFETFSGSLLSKCIAFAQRLKIAIY